MMQGVGFREMTPTMENQVKVRMESEMETGII